MEIIGSVAKCKRFRDENFKVGGVKCPNLYAVDRRFPFGILGGRTVLMCNVNGQQVCKAPKGVTGDTTDLPICPFLEV